MNILFVCSGNTCRSPMAEGYLNSKKIKGINAKSCGFISEGEPVSENAVAVMSEIGVDISAHKSRIVNRDLLSADKIYCMSRAHKDALISAGVKDEKIFVLGGGISDPFGGDITVYRACRDEIINAVDSLLYSGVSPVKISIAEKSDIKKIAELEKVCFSFPWSEKSIEEGMDYGATFFKAEYNGEFAGYIGVTAVSGEGYINNIAVDPDLRKKGIGAMLLDRAVVFSRQQKLDFLSLEVRESNLTAINLYKKAGFKKQGVRKNFYDNPKEDGIIMTRRFLV